MVAVGIGRYRCLCASCKISGNLKMDTKSGVLRYRLEYAMKIHGCGTSLFQLFCNTVDEDSQQKANHTPYWGGGIPAELNFFFRIHWEEEHAPGGTPEKM